MRESGGRAVVRALEDEGIPFTFGIPGTHNIELYDALGQSEAVTPVLVTDEQSASFMADAVWRSSGRIACVNLVPGAGLTHALSGIAEAYMDNVAMLVLGCGIRADTGHAYQLHDVDQLALAAPVTKAQLRPDKGEELYAVVRRACAIARGGAPGPVLVEVPADLYLIPHSTVEPDPQAWAPIAPPVVEPDDVEEAARMLMAAERPLLYLGLGAAAAGSEALVGLAQALEAPVATTFQGKGVFPESHALWLWPGFGNAAPKFVREIAKECDATLAIGCRFSEVATGSYGIEPPRPLIHVDIQPEVLGRNFETDLQVTADAATFVSLLVQRLATSGAGGRRPDLRRQLFQGHQKVTDGWLEMKLKERRREGEKVSPPRLLRALQDRFGSEAIFTADSGNGTFLGVECLRLDAPGHFLAPVDYSCMGYSVPAALGAALARPESQAIALAGDGAFLMTGLELLTAAARQVPVLVLVLRDRELAQIAQFQDVALGRKVASELPDYDLAHLCRGLGVECFSMATDSQIGPALEDAHAVLREGRPAVIDVAIDYSRKTYFTRGVVKTNLLRLPWRERLRMVGRGLARHVSG
jgi:acetolactate synthase-1/2/3 large subunit